MKFEIYEVNAKGRRLWNWRLRARNNRIVCQSTQGYTRKADALNAVLALRAYNVLSARIVER